MREPRPASRGRWGKDNFFCRRNYRAESLSPFPGGKVSFVNHSRPTRAATTTSGLNCRAGTVADLPACFPAGRSEDHSRPTRAATTTSGLNCRAGTVADLPACFPAGRPSSSTIPALQEQPRPLPVWIVGLERSQTFLPVFQPCPASRPYANLSSWTNRHRTAGT